MSTVRTILSLLTHVIERQPVRRRGRVQCRPSGDRMEPRALLSAFKVGVAALVPPPTAGGALVIQANPAPSFHVTYQVNQIHIADDIKDQINIENDVV
jgi:hypothetical protein